MEIKKEVVNKCQYKVGIYVNGANFGRLWKTRLYRNKVVPAESFITEG